MLVRCFFICNFHIAIISYSMNKHYMHHKSKESTDLSMRETQTESHFESIAKRFNISHTHCFSL